jgi:hypothetical protein
MGVAVKKVKPQRKQVICFEVGVLQLPITIWRLSKGEVKPGSSGRWPNLVIAGSAAIIVI